MKKLIKSNIFSFFLGAILFGGIGTVVATTILSSSVSYTNNNQTTVEGALDELYSVINEVCYNGNCGKLSYRYWNDGFSDTIYQTNEMPANNYLTRSLLEQNYGASNFTDTPIYIRSILIDRNVVGHQVCFLNNSKEFCLDKGYWAGTLNTNSGNAGIQTKIKLQRDMQESLGITIQDANCYSDTGIARCYVGDFYCRSHSSGNVDCHSNVSNKHCYVYGDGTSSCGQ